MRLVFFGVRIVVLNDFDEVVIGLLFQQGVWIDIYGVGIWLVIGYDQLVFGGVYKFGVVCDVYGVWCDVIKLLEQLVKIIDFGCFVVCWLCKVGELVVDIIYDSEVGWQVLLFYDIEDLFCLVWVLVFDDDFDLLVIYFWFGQLVCELDSLVDVWVCVVCEFVELLLCVCWFFNLQFYLVGLDFYVYVCKQQLIVEVWVFWLFVVLW